MTNPNHNTTTNTPTTMNTTTTDSAGSGRPPRSRATILGVSAGLIGGGLVGLAMTVPSLTSAAGEDTADTGVAALVAPGSAIQAPATHATADVDRGARLRATLQELVDAGTISSEQADAVADHLADQLADRRGHRGHRGGPGGHPGMDGEVVAELLGIDATELRSSLRDGLSIAELADANDVDVQIVVDALVAEAEEHLELAVENGRLTEAEAAEKLADLTERITARVNGERPVRG